MIYTVTLNPAVDKTVLVPNLEVDAVNRISELRQDAGGKGINVSKVIDKLGGASEAWAVLAGNAGSWIASQLKAQHIACAAFEVEGETRTNLKIIDPERHTNTDINEPGPELSQAQLDELLARLVDKVQSGDVVVLAGSLPRGAAVDTYGVWTARLKQVGVKVFLDADGEALIHGIEAGPHYIKPNDHELSGIVGRELTSVDEIAAAAQELRDKGLDEVVISMGGAGALFVGEQGVWQAGSVKVKVGSTVGAGDSVDAAVAYAEDQGLSLEETMRLAMATGAANVMQSGTQAADRATIDSLIDKVTVEKLG